ncbi:efflux transporter outer membrane subunit [Telmatospirillum sp.]|uniref:efflux transporter outer membrane subunit n=1 Tax=Telmatospirillum sp. TaxID=2079197 RepID=UPI0028467612|nr:efflux transporter outer membrane subunit [Telmatospirillum sp.]MDR3438658.1 efflux transporter outer membrane subunit [Telmatospirillum sp.]
MRFVPFLSLFLLAGCVVGPDYVRPAAPAPAVYKELQGWTPARPSDDIDRGDWWSIYNDPLLDQLERQIDIGNQNLRAYEAAYRKAQATVAEARAAYFPTVSASGSGQRQRSSTTIASTKTVEASASWDLDLWGKVRRQVESDQAGAEASAAELASIRLSAQSALAIDYFELRYQEQLARLLSETVDAYQRSLTIARNQYATGVAARSDVITAETQLKSTKASLIAAGVLRAQYEHAIAILIGKPPADLTIAPGSLPTTVQDVPVALPATLLQRRPDIAEAERMMQQQNALIGVQTAAYYPDISLSADFGYSSAGAALFKTSRQIWSLAASGTETVFDAGARGAAVEAARATYDQAVANYRQTVLSAFQDVEDGLSGLRILADQAETQAEAVASAREATRITLNEYKAGTTNYTTVVTAQATALSNEQTALGIMQSRMTTHVSLVKALGGGWTTDRLRD